MSEDILYQLALTAVPLVGPVQAKILLQHFNPPEIFRAKKHALEKIEGIGQARASAITSFRGFGELEREMAFMEKFRVRSLFITDPGYPQRLLNCYDSPILLFYKGSADLNASRIISVIGTRSHTSYGKKIAEEFVAEVSSLQITVVSGLAFGIDALAHRAAIRHQVPTVAVLAHGLDQVYPAEHTGLAREMLMNDGGLLTEFRSRTMPDRHHFPSRNRIVAGMSDATVVIETGLRGGSMITAELANGYNRDVFAVPGRLNDAKSEGCNQLIRNNKAYLLQGATDLAEVMGWTEKRYSPAGNQKELFSELSANEKLIVDILGTGEEMDIDNIRFQSGLSSSTVAAAILNLEIMNAILSLPGKRYRLS